MNDQDPSPGSSNQQFVFQKLDAGLNYRLVLLVESQTTTKVEVLRTWAERQNGDVLIPVAWLKLQEEDNHPEYFLEHLTTATDGLDPKYGGKISESWRELSGAGDPNSSTDPAESCSQAGQDFMNGMVDLINRLAEYQDGNPDREGFFLVLQDYHQISHPEIHSAVELLLDYLPPRMHVIITSHSEPPLQLPRLRVRRQLLELSESDL